MKSKLMPVLCLLAVSFGLAGFLSRHTLPAVSAQSAGPMGSYSYLVSSAEGVAMLGTMTFDGAGNVTGSYSIGGSRGGSSGSLTGSYSVGGSGAGTINLQLDTGISVTIAAAANNGGAGMQMLFTGGMSGLWGTALRQ